MDAVTIKSNGHARELRALYELPESAREQFDYVGPCDESSDEAWSQRFFKYRGAWYDVNEFERAHGEAFAAWDGWQAESAFSAVLIRYALEWDGSTVDYGAVVVGYAHW